MKSQELRIWMDLNGLTVETLSKECKKSGRNIRYWLRGERKIPPSFVCWTVLRDELKLARLKLDEYCSQ